MPPKRRSKKGHSESHQETVEPVDRVAESENNETPSRDDEERYSRYYPRDHKAATSGEPRRTFYLTSLLIICVCAQ